MLRIKDGVDMRMLQPQLLPVIIMANEVCNNYGVDCVITSGSDGKHSRKSKHYLGAALDLRTREMTATQVSNLATALSNSLGDQYDVLIEADHIHVEWDPEF